MIYLALEDKESTTRGRYADKPIINMSQALLRPLSSTTTVNGINSSQGYKLSLLTCLIVSRAMGTTTASTMPSRSFG